MVRDPAGRNLQGERYKREPFDPGSNRLRERCQPLLIREKQSQQLCSPSGANPEAVMENED